MSDLDKDFQRLAIKINAKLKLAADSLREANELRAEAGLPSLIITQWERDALYSQFANEAEASEESNNPDFDEDEFIELKMEEYESKFDAIDVSDLEEELGRAGWSTSSSYC
jgi:hypothetical protein